MLSAAGFAPCELQVDSWLIEHIRAARSQGCSEPGLLLLYQLLLGEDGSRGCVVPAPAGTSQLQLYKAKQPSIPGHCWQGMEMKEDLHAHVCTHTHKAPGGKHLG